jgi:cytochrome c oxidase assembly protein subunit 15
MNAVEQSESPWPSRMAWVLACATFPLIWIGGLVTSYDAGMAVPDWPSTYGYNMFRYPLKSWFFGPWDLFVEHGHRLLGALVGMLAIGLVVVCLGTRTRQSVRWAACGVLLLVILQGLLGGLRVRMNSRLLAQFHGIVGPLFFAATAGMIVWTTRMGSIVATADTITRLRHLGLLVCCLLLLQLLMGSQIRHVDGQMPGETFRLATLLHVLLAVVLVIAASYLAIVAWRTCNSQLLRLLTVVGLGLFAGQVSLGVITWLSRFGWPAVLSDYNPLPGWTVQAGGFWQSIPATAHVATAALILANYFAITVWTWRELLARTRPPASADPLGEAA